MMPNIGPLEIAIVLVIVLLIFGPKRLPELGRSMGAGLREFKDSIRSGGRSAELRGGDEDAVRDARAADGAAADLSR